MAAYHFSYPSQLESEDQMLDDLQSVLELNEITGGLAWRFTLVVSEAFTNALIHGNLSEAKRLITLDLQVNEMDLIADIADEGQGGLDRIRNRTNSSDLMDEGGRGIKFMEKYADRVDYRESPTGGLMVTIVVRLKQTAKTI